MKKLKIHKTYGVVTIVRRLISAAGFVIVRVPGIHDEKLVKECDLK